MRIYEDVQQAGDSNLIELYELDATPSGAPLRHCHV